MKAYVKYIVVTIICVAIFAIILINSRSEKNTSNNNGLTAAQATTTEKETTSKKKKKEMVDRETIYHQNIGIDQLIDDYNEMAEIEITPDMVNKGSYSVNANILVDDISVIMYNTDSSISIDYSYEGKSDDAIYPLFRDFSKAMKPSLKNKKIKKAWNEIKEGDYSNTSFYNLKGIEVTYITGQGDNGMNHYLIRTKINKEE